MTTRIDPETALCGVVLHPAGHTRSPAMHNAAFRALGTNAVYVAFDVPPDRLAAAIAGMRALQIRQLAVSIPHKVAVLDLVDEVDDTARAIGAANTVTLRDGRLHATNTDWRGVTDALLRARPDGLDGARAVVLGAGGTARAAIHGLRSAGCSVTVLNRTESKARALADELGAVASGSLADCGDLPEWDLLVNTTSVGLRDHASPLAAEAIRPGTVVLDAVYDPPRTRLLEDAATRGAETVEGKWMLVHQAAAQLQLWTGQKAPIEVMAEAFDTA